MISVTSLTVLVYLALAMAIATPVILTALVIKDWKSGKLW